MTKSSLQIDEFYDRNNVQLIAVDNISRAGCFYEAALGFKHTSSPLVNHIQTALMILNYTTIILSEDKQKNYKFNSYNKKQPYKTNIIINVYNENIDRLFLKAIANSAISIQEPSHNSDGFKYCILQDVYGYRWVFINS